MVSVASVYTVASGMHGVPVAVAWQTRTVAPATGCPLGPKTISSLRDPCDRTQGASAAKMAAPAIARAIREGCRRVPRWIVVGGSRRPSRLLGTTTSQKRFLSCIAVDGNFGVMGIVPSLPLRVDCYRGRL